MVLKGQLLYDVSLVSVGMARGNSRGALVDSMVTWKTKMKQKRKDTVR